MENRAHAILTGLFTVVFATVIVLAFLWFRGDTRAYNEYLLVSTYTVNGLYPQAEVRFRGINVGKVADLSVDLQDPRNILIRVLVQKEIPITKGAYAQLGYQGLTGIAYVTIDDDGSNLERVPVAPGRPGRIPVRASLLDELANAGRTLLNQTSGLLERLNRLISEDNEKRLSQTLANLEEASAQLAPTLRTIPEVAARTRKFLSDENAQRLSRSLANLEEASSAITPIAEDSRKVLASMQNLSTKLDRMSSELSTSISDSTLPRINTLVDQLSQDSRDLHRVLLQIEREPQSLLFGRAPAVPGPGEPGFTDGKK